ncbi:hypothetical protein BUALT_Bualt10G0074600 [Buddleja alternifolia]|uniref:F-box domain-containing protein n=1 Tax=Buddleja alternifolia TaxID=168488 RepID=A0AAV6WW06_9LAMI|nr:hypothetical protein BUALT_Bualt10G0074600 [Buddleja alternifolia]
MSMTKGRRIGGVVEDQKTLKYEIVVDQFCLMDLPTAVLHEILFRLPINSIIKVKFVCRALYKLLSDSHFALNYTKISPFATLVGTSNFLNYTFYTLDLLSDSYGCIQTTFKPKIPGVSGFDLERSTLLIIVKGSEIFTNGIDETWRGLANPTIPFSWFSGNNFIALNCIFLWFIVGNGSSWIFTFDLGEEKVGRLSHPHGLELNMFYMELKSINNQLCLVDSTDPCVIVMWKMKEYGVAESWTKDIILDTSFTSDLLRCRSRFPETTFRFPETILPNGDILFSSTSGNHLISCNPTKRKVTQTRVRSYRRIN